MRLTMGNAAVGVKYPAERIYGRPLAYFVSTTKASCGKLIVSMPGKSVGKCVFSALGETTSAR